MQTWPDLVPQKGKELPPQTKAIFETTQGRKVITLSLWWASGILVTHLCYSVQSPDALLAICIYSSYTAPSVAETTLSHIWR